MKEPRHFRDLDRLSTAELQRILSYARAFKDDTPPGKNPRPLAGKTLAMLFEKPSTRTRISFEVGMQQMGGSVVVLEQSSSQLGRGEALSDTARVLARYVDIIMLRTTSHDNLDVMCREASIPVINGLTDYSHPCQIVADILTFEERLGPIQGRRIAWIGDGNNVAVSWIQAAARLGFSLCLACPEDLLPDHALIEWANQNGGHVIIAKTPADAAREADSIVTDTWVSMGQEAAEKRQELLQSYRVDAALMAVAKPEAIFMHCLPAHRGAEVTAAVIDGPQSAVWDEAENRLHAQKGILYWCLIDD